MQNSRRFRVCYTKHFVSGPMIGLTHKTSVHFPDASSATRFRASLVPAGQTSSNQVCKPCAGISHFTVSDVYVLDLFTEELVP